ncbi:glycosyl transferase family 1 isoform A [Chlorella sorokiniana]|uniref:Glycosyl transferase family 1 isoform A n=1 Tax=Chlorella sorokiniana TaxID=3076 RepID=A0A2P6TC77_CHLSO|nr:glycosyl transferase family 1 isoform A [Chlorella sorokiniana]|eukprot:PRW20237.1 glycosyl transferase family 1 isoform A [Chlorella sorokiniana]
MRRLKRARQQEEEEQQRAAEAAAAEIAKLQLRHVLIPPIVVNPDATMALAHSSGAWHHEKAGAGDMKQQGCPANSSNSSDCTCGGAHCGIIVVVQGGETAFSHVSLSPATAADR